jgi:acyl-coenzyme A synthetase/AMP-(fatty) acid ligase
MKWVVYWCTANIGWITGHSYVIFGPLIPNWPDPSVWWRIPNAIRLLMR